ncbi:ATP:cob(I)alamin adenosyltransferase [Candidatus Woesearchaeota archaeon]|nr:ATP:cob(I)alamin adenosyltransferase [Candidatus Woesearchaeota archaeon]
MRKAYTGKGDSGYTKRLDGSSVRKDDAIIVAGGKVDSLLSALDAARYYNPDYAMDLDTVADRLRYLGGELSGGMKQITSSDLTTLEQRIHAIGEPPAKFIRFLALPAIALNECRTRCREAEVALAPLYHAQFVQKDLFAYVNRLSSYFYLLALAAETRKV